MIWRRIVRDYFTFNKREARGVYSLIVLLLVLSGIHLLLRLYPSAHQSVSDEEITAFNALAQSFEHGKPHEDFVKSTLLSPSSDKDRSIEWRQFDPNEADSKELVELGLKPWIAERVVNYREKVKPYSSINDLKAVYDIDTNWLSQAAPFIKIDSQYVGFTYEEEVSFRQDKIQQEGDSSNIVFVDLNSADTTELKSIQGIGSFYAKQIVELRERYRGFRSFDQLLDLYKVSDETLTLLSEKSTIDTSAVRKIDLNTCTIEELGRHPYLSWKQARIVIAYRDQHDYFTSIKEIMRTDVISDSVYLKIAPYLEVK